MMAMASEPKYRIVRIFTATDNRRVLRRGLSLAAAKAWCDNPESNSATATSREARMRTERSGSWADFMFEEVSPLNEGDLARLRKYSADGRFPVRRLH
jgi:hypothetical protein